MKLTSIQTEQVRLIQAIIEIKNANKMKGQFACLLFKVNNSYKKNKIFILKLIPTVDTH